MNIVVLAGGISSERDVSLSSGATIYRALKERGHKAVLLDVYLGYEWETQTEERKIAGLFESDRDWAGDLGSVAVKKPDISQIKAMRRDGDKNFFGPNVLAICQEADAASICWASLTRGQIMSVRQFVWIRGFPRSCLPLAGFPLRRECALKKGRKRRGAVSPVWSRPAAEVPAWGLE